ncbi:uncharacterized protein BO72DRAFT_443945 [Aspergillus fijiensis CBS 313.89]|uniref:Uncharacterized protein n=1 Tax=Aspergillus fijiensis CBS 313.89 TaxID=1448319 RepID=A0A8G1S0K3_9EURO|nr:uncharacterized protein BO72DRAFT_443945 [Aspergillus fijiensis CBS 313.89]RAK82483.1 hypothetical protein BO72DRAFT_443945 [Aspergillus fijiensis CBS 313.89]
MSTLSNNGIQHRVHTMPCHHISDHHTVPGFRRADTPQHHILDTVQKAMTVGV